MGSVVCLRLQTEGLLSNGCQISKNWALRTLRPQRSLSLPPFDAQTLRQHWFQWSSGFCQNTAVMGNTRPSEAALSMAT